jgi:DNA-binding YbaB/EbfC family protein
MSRLYFIQKISYNKSMFDQLKKLKELRDQAKDLQNALAQVQIPVEEAGGKIKLIVDGNQKVLSLDIDPELLSPDKKDELQKGLTKAFEEATKKAQQKMAEQVRQGGMGLPGLM